MEFALTNPNPPHCLSKDDPCYIAINNIGGGDTIKATIIRSTILHNKNAYTLTYRQPIEPYGQIQAIVPVTQIFKTLNDANEARKTDMSAQNEAIARACSNPVGLVLFLLSRAELSQDEEAAVIRTAKLLNLYPNTTD